MSEKNKIQALISLLDDTDEQVVSVVSNNLIKEGNTIVPVLEKAWEYTINALMQERIENIIHRIQSGETFNELNKWVHEGALSLIKGAYLIARHRYPDLQFEYIQAQIRQITRDIWLEINDNLTALEKVRIINRVLFDFYGFSIEQDKQFNPRTSYINELLDTRKGNSISMSILYMTLAEKLDIPISGINLPNTFIMAYLDKYSYGELFRDNVLFYIDPLTKGAVAGRKEIDYYIAKLKLKPHESFYVPCNNLKIIQRLVAHLIYSYDKHEENSKAEQLKGIFSMLNVNEEK